MNRRQFALGAGALAASLTHIAANARDGSDPATRHDAAMARSVDTSGYAAVAFDGLVIFDVRESAAAAADLFRERGAELLGVWRARQFEYQWLRALSGQYADFLSTTDAALTFAARQLGLDVDGAARARLLAPYRDLNVWPDVADALAALRRSGLRVALLSNMTGDVMQRGLARGGIGDLFEAVLSTDASSTYKPDPRAYRLGTDALHLPKERILFAAFAGWDVAGAKWFGYPTFWVNRANAPAEALGIVADGAGDDLRALVRFATEPVR